MKTFILLSLFFFLTHTIFSQAGALDTTFGTGGITELIPTVYSEIYEYETGTV
ncbi:MAG: hypothetical protein H7Y00_06340, partial [Fimbriimonadaceae bacterium]|nr:hypothetical protein [Chitinophagales bacterium]